MSCTFPELVPASKSEVSKLWYLHRDYLHVCSSGCHVLLFGACLEGCVVVTDARVWNRVAQMHVMHCSDAVQVLLEKNPDEQLTLEEEEVDLSTF